MAVQVFFIFEGKQYLYEADALEAARQAGFERGVKVGDGYIVENDREASIIEVERRPM